MSLLVSEIFEGAGYENPFWTETVSGGSTVDEDAASSDVGSPPGWGSQCLKLVHVGGTVVSARVVQALLPDITLKFRYMQFELVVTSNGLADGQIASLARAVGAGSLLGVSLSRTAGVTSILAQANDDAAGLLTDYWSAELELNRVYRFEFEWQEIERRWTIWVDGTRQAAGCIFADAVGVVISDLHLGDPTSGAGAYTAYYDRVFIEDTTPVGPILPAFGFKLAPTQRAG